MNSAILPAHHSGLPEILLTPWNDTLKSSHSFQAFSGLTAQSGQELGYA
jgi:hypothetical protein